MFLGEYFIIEVVLIEIWVDFLWFSLRIAGNKCWVWVLFDYLDMIRVLFFWYEFDMNLMVKKYDFDRVVLFANFVWLKSIDFTGVLNDWWDVNRWFLMCYFIIKYSVFGGVRENALFIRVWGDFRVEYWWFLMVLKVMKCLIFQGFVEVDIEVVFWVEFGWNASKTLILQGVCGLKRYAVPGFRLSVLKCKPRPIMA